MQTRKKAKSHTNNTLWWDFFAGYVAGMATFFAIAVLMPGDASLLSPIIVSLVTLAGGRRFYARFVRPWLVDKQDAIGH